MLTDDVGRLLSFRFAAHFGNGFGHFGGLHHRGRGIIFGARLLEFCLAAAFALAVATMTRMTVADWTRRRFGEEGYANAAGWGAFLLVAAVLGFGIARLI